MRVGFVTSQLDSVSNDEYYSLGGPESYVKSVAKNLAKRDDVEVVLIRKNDNQIPLYENCNTVATVKNIDETRLQKKHNIELIHYPNTLIPSRKAQLQSKLSPTLPRIATLHGVEHYFSEYRSIKTEDLKVALGRKKRLLEENLFLDTFDKIITPSSYAKKVLQKNNKIVSNKIEVVYHGVDDIFFESYNPELPKNFKDKYEIGDEFYLHVSNNVKSKSPDIVKKVNEQVKTSKLIVAGDGWNSDKKINNVGRVNVDILKKLYQNASLLLHPSELETFGFTVVEAMASGCPIVANKRAALPEIVGDGGVLLSDYSDWRSFVTAVEGIVSDKTKQKRLSQNAIERAKHFNWTSSINKLLRVYQDAIENH